MERLRQSSGEYASSHEIHRILRTSLAIFDSVVTLLGEPSACGVSLPGPGQIECVRYILHSLCLS
jgi:hypothetical protein